MNILFVTLDQFRGDSYGAAGHPFVKTPVLDAIAAEGVRLTQHYSQSSPCSPGRAALYTGTYQMNNRVVANGTPHPRHFDNIALFARRCGYDPTLFGYTDQGLNPYDAVGAEDPRLDSYEGILPGFSIGCYLPNDQSSWLRWLHQLGYDVPDKWYRAAAQEPERPAEHSLTAFLTNRFLEWLDHADEDWFAHVSYLRPHSPYAAAGEYSTMYDPALVDMPIPAAVGDDRHPLHEKFLGYTPYQAPSDEAAMRELKAQYYGMISEVDTQLGRVVEAIKQRGEWDNTVVIITSDHGEQLGDHGLIEKLLWYPQSYHVLGIWRDPNNRARRKVIDEFTENVDVLATLADTFDVECPAQVDGRSMLPLFKGESVEWRIAAHYEWDWRNIAIATAEVPWPRSRELSRMNLAVGVTTDTAYVQFGDGNYLCFDIGADPTWRTECTDESRILIATQELLQWRQEHLGREFTDMFLSPQRFGRWPQELGL